MATGRQAMVSFSLPHARWMEKIKMIHRFSGSFINNHKEQSWISSKISGWGPGSRGKKAGSLSGSTKHVAWT